MIGIKPQRLSKRQRQVAELAAAGLATEIIAMQLRVSHQTIKNTLHIAYRKLLVKNRSELREALTSPSQELQEVARV